MSAFGPDYRRVLRSPKKYQRASMFWIKKEIAKLRFLVFRFLLVCCVECWVNKIKELFMKGRKGMCMGSGACGERSFRE